MNELKKNTIFNSLNKSHHLSATGWITWKNKLFLVKKYEEIEEAIYEIITSKISQFLNIPTATYYLVKIENKYGVITENFNPHQKELINLYDILKIYQEKNHSQEVVNNLNNLEMINKAIFNYTHNQEETNQIMKQLINTMLLQIICGDIDRRPKNILFFKDNHHLKMAPNFDYGGCFSIDLKIDDSIPYALGMNYANTQFYDPYLTIQDFLKEVSNFELFRNLQNLLNHFEEILKETEQENNLKIPLELKEDIFNNLSNNIEYIQNLNLKKGSR